MTWLKAYYDKIILIVAALLLAAGAFFIYRSSTEFVAVFESRNSSKKPDHTIPELPVDAVHQVIHLIKEPGSWVVHENGGFILVPRPYVVRDGKLIPALEGDAKIHDPIPNQWLIDYNLDYVRADLLQLDPDGDGFTVLEEWRGGTDPTNPESVPPYYLKLRLQEYISIPFRLKFTGSPDGGNTFSINTLDVSQPTQFVEIGDEIKGTPFKVLRYEEDSVTEQGIVKDASRLIIENTEKGGTVTLVANKIVDSPTSKGQFINLLDGTVFEVTKGESFTLPQEPDQPYKLIDISNEQALIQDSSGKERTIPKVETEPETPAEPTPETP